MNFSRALKKSFPSAIIMLLVSYVIGLCALTASYMIPSDTMNNSMLNASEVMQIEGTYPTLSELTASRLDNFTDAKMLLTAAYDGDEGLLEKVLMGYSRRIEGTTPAETLVELFGENESTGNEIVTSYSRYWQGYLIVLKPLLVFLGYSQIRILNIILQLCLVALTMWKLHKAKLKALIPPLLTAYIAISPLAVGMSLQYSSVFYIGFAGALSVLWLAKRRDYATMLLLFFGIGIATSYFDFLTYPLFTLGIPLIICVAWWLTYSEEFKLKHVLGLCITWGLGYALMWAGKWVIAALLLADPSIITDAIDQVLYRSSASNSLSEASATESPEGYSILATIYRNIKEFISPVSFACIVLVLVPVPIRLLRNRELRHSFNRKLTILLLIAVLPIAWYIAIGNHSYVHYFFTFRILSVSLLAVLAMLYLWIIPVQIEDSQAMGGREFASQSRPTSRKPLEVEDSQASTGRELASHKGQQ